CMILGSLSTASEHVHIAAAVGKEPCIVSVHFDGSLLCTGAAVSHLPNEEMEDEKNRKVEMDVVENTAKLGLQKVAVLGEHHQMRFKAV
ncbi:hypothetical protein STEG23_002188, partial [Scotinomys teguina]